MQMLGSDWGLNRVSQIRLYPINITTIRVSGRLHCLQIHQQFSLWVEKGDFEQRNETLEGIHRPSLSVLVKNLEETFLHTSGSFEQGRSVLINIIIHGIRCLYANPQSGWAHIILRIDWFLSFNDGDPEDPLVSFSLEGVLEMEEELEYI